MTSIPLHAFADWVESHPTDGLHFFDWLESFWPEWKKKCTSVCTNVYVMSECVAAFRRRLQIDTTWEMAIDNPALQQEMEDICASVQLYRADFFSDSAKNTFESRCRKIFQEKV